MTTPAKTARITSGKSSLGKFLGKHAGELSQLTGILGTITRVIPMDPATKRGINAALTGLNAAAGRIAETAPKADAVSLSLSDIREAVSPILAEIVKPMIAELLAELVAGEGVKTAVTEAMETAVASAVKDATAPDALRKALDKANKALAAGGGA